MGYTSCIELDSNTANIALTGQHIHRLQSYMDEETLREALSSRIVVGAYSEIQEITILGRTACRPTPK
jgi:hypothetical protein